METKLDLITEQQHVAKLLVSGSYFTITEIEAMHKWLSSFFYRSQMNGLIEIDTYDRDVIKKLLKLPDNCR
jgi:hypothetical protein